MFKEDYKFEFHLGEKVIPYRVALKHLHCCNDFNDKIFTELGLNAKKFASQLWSRDVNGAFPEWKNNEEKASIIQALEGKIATTNKEFFKFILDNKIQFYYKDRIYNYTVTECYLRNTKECNNEIFNVLGIDDKNRICENIYKYPIKGGKGEYGFPEYCSYDVINCRRIIEFLASKCDKTEIYDKEGKLIKTIEVSRRFSFGNELKVSDCLTLKENKTEKVTEEVKGDERVVLTLPKKAKQYTFKNLF